MEVTENHKFNNEATRRFHDYFKPYTEKSREHAIRFYEAFGLADTENPSQFFNKLKTGKQNITLKHIYIAKNEFGLNPGYLFETSDQEQLGFGSSIVEEPISEYGYRDADIQKQVGAKLDVILKKHKIKIEPYAKQRLGITKQAFYDKLKGKSRQYFDEVLVVCEDTGESLDQFRRTPLPKGHHLHQLEMMEEMLEMLKAENKELKKQMKGKK